MQIKHIKQTVFLCAISTMLAIGLTGCVKGKVSVDVKWTGSTVVSITLGMTQQAQSLVASQGENTFQDIEKTMADKTGKIPAGIEVEKWRESDYDWISVTKKFSSLEQVNDVMTNNTLFNSFSLTRNRGIFRDEFILDAELAALSNDMPSSDYAIDPTAFIDMSFSARLPGTIVETNGFADLEDPNLLTWNAQGYQNVSIKARSLSWNWLNLFLIMGAMFGLFIFGIYAFGGFDFLLAPKKIPYYVSPGQHTLPQNEPVLQSPAQPLAQKTNYIVELGIEDLLNQVNTRMLNSIGEMRIQPMEIALLWKDEQGAQRFIYIKDLGNHEIAINGKNFSATRDNVKAGIKTVLQKQKET